ncbi:unnamed protein product [Larinioides sclopetarius]|uniref:C2H2-type domain-containing protein n=1 Tax=Larinioides sclopetarius TaxID=280406 RepID=A0AAV2A815_9ARAC
MAETPFSPPRSESPGYYVPAADASTQTTDEDFIFLEPTRDASTQTTDEDFIFLEPTRDASTQTTDEDFILLKPIRDASTQTTEGDFDLLAQIQSGRNISIGTLESSVDTSETVFSGFHENRNNCDEVKNEVDDVSSSIRASTDFDMASGSRNRVESSECYMQPPFPENVLHYSRQSTHENNNTVSIQGKHTVDYPTVYMECRTLNEDVCGINEAARNKNVDNFHPQGPEPRNVAVESCMPLAFPENIAHYSRQSIQHESNKNTFSQGTLPVDFPASTHKSNHSSRQHTEENGSRNASAQGTKLIKISALPSSKKSFTCKKCRMKFRKEYTFNIHVLSNCVPKKFKCDECGRKFHFHHQLKFHSRIHKEKSFKCDKCAYVTYSNYNLKKHFNNIHIK